MTEGASALTSRLRELYLGSAAGEESEDRAVLRALRELREIEQRLEATFVAAAPSGNRSWSRSQVEQALIGVELEGELDSGGRGTVFLARAESHQRQRESESGAGRASRFAVKVFPLAADPHRVEALLRELEVLRDVEHPGLVPLRRVTTLPGVAGAAPEAVCVAMDYWPGTRLSEQLESGPWGVEATVRAALNLSGALAEAHSRGVLHRDVKPGNVLVSEAGEPKLVDFAIERLYGLNDFARGALCTSAPEHLRGESLTPAADVFSLGALVYEMLTGANPFSEGSLQERLFAVLHEQPPPLDRLVADVPPWLVHCVERCLDKVPARRFVDASGVLEVFEQESAGERVVLSGESPITSNPSQSAGQSRLASQSGLERRMPAANRPESAPRAERELPGPEVPTWKVVRPPRGVRTLLLRALLVAAPFLLLLLWLAWRLLV